MYDQIIGWSMNVLQSVERKPKYSEKTYPRAKFSTINPTWPDLETHFKYTINKHVILKHIADSMLDLNLSFTI
jgi:hypothetical protein